ncbi:phage tail protein [Paenibacillus soyae]|uniref:Phage tail protein n=1 Tax=Paenibacillus soyae TaxID=2969249 RepID=A0A9X2MKU1_9BACL|nr:phage tail protein [Paenibacillus soyae]MCR2802449.1 phage tail protein [Paenibacillus soyae]
MSKVKEMAIAGRERIYLLDERADLWSYDWRGADYKRMFPQGHGLFGNGTRLAASDSILYAADPDGALSAFHAGNGQTMWSRHGATIDGLPFHPLAVAADDRSVYVLTPLDTETGDEGDAIPEGGSLAVLQFTAGGQLSRVHKHPLLRQPVRVRLRHLNRAYFLAVSKDGDIHVFDSIFARLIAMQRNGEAIQAGGLPSKPYSGLCLDSGGTLYLGDASELDQDEEDDRFILTLDRSGRLLGEITSYRGGCDQLLADASDRLYILSGERETITLLNLQPQTVRMEETGVPEGIWLSRAFDSTETGTVWHKLTLDGFIPEGTQLRFSYFSSDNDHAVIEGTYRKLDDWIEDAGVSLKRKLAALSANWSAPILNPKDALFIGAKGRYLWLMIEWIGTERHTPSIERIRLYFPRETYLNYLPAVYQEDEESRDFLERYLSMFGTLFSELETEIGDLSRFIDPHRAEGEHLRWLATWLGLAADDSWTDEQVRAFIHAAHDLYRYRGTKRGMLQTIETYTGMEPIIVEQFQTKAMRDNAELRTLMEQLYGDNPYSFTVLLRPEQAPSEKQRVVIEELLEEQKPAYTEAKLVQLQPWMYLDLHTYLGINTVLTEPSILTLNADRSMPNDTLIVDVGMEKRMDVHTRLELDSELE